MKRALPLIIILSLLCCTVLCTACSSSKAILFYEGEPVIGDEIAITVDADVTEVRLFDKITVHDGYSWKLYADKTGLVEIPTKVAANVLTGELANGNNKFYLVATGKDGKYMFMYTVTVFRHYTVTINYTVNGQTVYRDVAPENKPYTVLTTIPDYTWDNGYTFDGWKNSAGEIVTSFTFDENSTVVSLSAAVTPKTTTVTLQDGDNAPIIAIITYGQPNTLPVPDYTQEGYRFAGWELRPDLTSAPDGSLDGYNSAYQETMLAFARWEMVP